MVFLNTKHTFAIFVIMRAAYRKCSLAFRIRKWLTVGLTVQKLVYQLSRNFSRFLCNRSEFEGKITYLRSEKYELSYHIKIYTTSGYDLGVDVGMRIRSAYASSFKVCLKS